MQTENDIFDAEIGEDGPDLAKVEAALREQQAEQLEKLSGVLCKKRSAAIDGRKASGIEQEWQDDEDAYEGIDDVNRASVQKPINSDGGVIGPRRSTQTRSTVFVNITRPYVDAASARVADMLLPTDDSNWSINPSPIPDIEYAMNDQTPVLDEQGNQVFATPHASPQLQAQRNLPGAVDMQGQGQTGVPPAQGQPKPMTAADLAARIQEEARRKSDKAGKRIEDWHVECQYHAEVRKVIEDCARMGTGVLKGPFPIKKRFKKASMAEGGYALEIVEKINPASKRVSPWNFYPDPSCGENIHNGTHCFEKDYLTTRQLRDLKGTPGYLAWAIDEVVEEGPQKRNTSDRRRSEVKDDERFETWYFYGFLCKKDLDAAGISLDDEDEVAEEMDEGYTDEEAVETNDMTPVIVTLVNDSIIKISHSPLDSGEFPYDVMPWQRRQESPFGIGVARQINTAQRMLNAAARNMMDNAGISAGPQIVVRKGVVTPADGRWEITPRKMWYVNEDADVQSVQQAFMSINITALQQDLQAIIQYAMKLAEDTTGMPLLMQGQQGAAPETVGGMTMLNNNASSVLRRIARTFDDYITEPHIRRYYEWLLIWGEDEDEKGDFVVDARGSSALVERDMQNQAYVQMGQMVMNPAFGIDPKKWFAEAYCKAFRIDPKRLQYTPEEMQQMAAQQQQQPPAPQVQAAQIRAETDKYKADKMAEVTIAKTQADTDRDSVYVQSEAMRTQTQADAKLQELSIKRELALLEYANKHQIAIEKVKAELAATAMKLQTQKELTAATINNKAPTATPQVARPATEPPGKAPDGQAFQR